LSHRYGPWLNEQALQQPILRSSSTAEGHRSLASFTLRAGKRLPVGARGCNIRSSCSFCRSASCAVVNGIDSWENWESWRFKCADRGSVVVLRRSGLEGLADCAPPEQARLVAHRQQWFSRGSRRPALVSGSIIQVEVIGLHWFRWSVSRLLVGLVCGDSRRRALLSCAS